MRFVKKIDEFSCRLLLNLLPNLGSVGFNKLLGFYKSARAVLEADFNEAQMVAGVKAGTFDVLNSQRLQKEFETELRLIDKYRVKVISIDDAAYPRLLKQIYDPPVLLFVKGDLSAPEPAVSIVGARRASLEGIEQAKRFGFMLANLKMVIVSGLARGIDTAAHRGCLSAAGRTIAVLGSGLANIYPPENEELASKISQQGAVVSEFPMNTPPKAINFPRRNRIISGLSLGVVVIEAAARSGALITADFALEQNRQVFAFPGRPISSKGCNRLIKEGAALVEEPDEVAQELGISVAAIKDFFVREDNKVTDAKEEAILSVMKENAVSCEEIVDQTGLSSIQVLQSLTVLELKGLVKQLAGKRYISNQGRG